MVQTAPKAKAVAYSKAEQAQVSKQAQVAPKAPSVQRSQTRQLELMVSKTRCTTATARGRCVIFNLPKQAQK